MSQPTIHDEGHRVRIVKGYGLTASGETGVLVPPLSDCYYGAYVRLDVSGESRNFDWKDLALLEGRS